MSSCESPLSSRITSAPRWRSGSSPRSATSSCEPRALLRALVDRAPARRVALGEPGGRAAAAHRRDRRVVRDAEEPRAKRRVAAAVRERDERADHRRLQRVLRVRVVAQDRAAVAVERLVIALVDRRRTRARRRARPSPPAARRRPGDAAAAGRIAARAASGMGESMRHIIGHARQVQKSCSTASYTRPMGRRGAIAAALRVAAAASRRSGAAGGSSALPRLSPRSSPASGSSTPTRGLTPPPSLLAQIRAGQAAGVIFFGANISSAAQLRVGDRAAPARRTPRARCKAPLLMMTDQEGGLVRRLPGAPALSEKQIGAARERRRRSPQRRAPAPAQTLRGRRHQRQPRAGARRLPPAGQLHRPLPALLRLAAPPSSGRSARRSSRPSSARGVAATAKHFPGSAPPPRAQDTDLRPVTLERLARDPAQPSTRRPTAPRSRPA